MKTPQAPLSSPPKLHVVQMMQGDETSIQTNIQVREQLQRTVGQNAVVRRKIFKSLCARWHPDKNLSRNPELATEVFQYLQAQKDWYLHE